MPDTPDDWPEQLEAGIRQLIERYGFYKFEEVASEIIELESKRLEVENEARRGARVAALARLIHRRVVFGLADVA